MLMSGMYGGQREPLEQALQYSVSKYTDWLGSMDVV